MPKAGFDTEGGKETGFGHLGRCIGLAQALNSLGWEVAFWSLQESSAASYVMRHGFPLENDRGDWDVTVFDRRNPVDVTEISALPRSVLIDDFGDGRLAADLVVYPPTSKPHHLDWTGASGNWVEGFDYALLRREFWFAPSRDPRFVLVSLGGSDAHRIVEPVLAEVRDGAGAKPVVLLAGPGMDPLAADVRVVRDPPSVAHLFSQATVTVSTFGHSLLELAACGTPAISLSPSGTSAVNAKEFCAAGTAAHVSSLESVAYVLRELLNDETRLQAMSARGRSLVDGAGALRVAHRVAALVP